MDRAPDVHVTVARVARFAHVATVSGELDARGAAALRVRLWPLVDGSARGRLIVDLSGVTFVDRAAIELLARAGDVLRANGRGLLVVATPDPRLRRLFEVDALPESLDVESSLAEAVEHVVGA